VLDDDDRLLLLPPRLLPLIIMVVMGWIQDVLMLLLSRSSCMPRSHAHARSSGLVEVEQVDGLNRLDVDGVYDCLTAD